MGDILNAYRGPTFPPASPANGYHNFLQPCAEAPLRSRGPPEAPSPASTHLLLFLFLLLTADMSISFLNVTGSLWWGTGQSHSSLRVPGRASLQPPPCSPAELLIHPAAIMTKPGSEACRSLVASLGNTPEPIFTYFNEKNKSANLGTQVITSCIIFGTQAS